MKIHENIIGAAAQGRKLFAVLIDPDKCSNSHCDKIVGQSLIASVDLFLLGGSLIMQDKQEAIMRKIRQETNIPVALFPGNNQPISSAADAILLLSLISGRNPELLIGRHVLMAPFLKASSMEIIPTGYMLIESGTITSAHYMSQTMPIPRSKPDIAASTALAGEMLGMKMIYLDAGSGAPLPVPVEMIRKVRNMITIPLVVGGGITDPNLVQSAFEAGADLVVAGNIFERDPALIPAMAAMRKQVGKSSQMSL
jgi:putative glycerol-1-phosphate prenyltransferase